MPCCGRGPQRSHAARSVAQRRCTDNLHPDDLASGRSSLRTCIMADCWVTIDDSRYGAADRKFSNECNASKRGRTSNAIGVLGAGP